jgi:hypothetical protein
MNGGSLEEHFTPDEIAKMPTGLKEEFKMAEKNPDIKIAELVERLKEILGCDEVCYEVQQNLNDFSRLSGNIYHLMNLNLYEKGLTLTNLKNQDRTQGKSAYVALKEAMTEASSNPLRVANASFNAHYGIANYMVKNFEEIQKDLQTECKININLNDNNIVAQLVRLVVINQNNPAHKINHCIPEKVLVPC